MKLEGWSFQYHPPDLWGQEGGQRLDQSPMAYDLISRDCEWALSKNPKGQDLESFWVGHHIEMLGG